jgi:hypothetical protein
MYLIQLLLPLTDNDGNEFPQSLLREVQNRLCEKFGGLTAYTRSPAKGIWAIGPEQQKDDIVMVEVMADKLDTAWWKQFRHELEARLRQDEIVLRATEFQKL